MSKDKYPCIFKSQIGIFLSFRWSIFSHMMRFDQSARERKYLNDYNDR